MVDRISPEQRRKCMQGNKSEDTKPEILVRKFLYSRGFHYRLHCKNLPGKPDIVLKKYSTVIFINGCFWHGHSGCKYYRLPSTNVEFWEKKVETNKTRDLKVKDQLTALGWGVMVVWECQLKKPHLENTLNEIVYNLSIAYLKKKKTVVCYNQDDDDSLPLAAEENTEYGK